MSLEGLGETIWIDRSVAAVRGSVGARVVGVQGDRAPIYSARARLDEIKPGVATIFAIQEERDCCGVLP